MKLIHGVEETEIFKHSGRHKNTFVICTHSFEMISVISKLIKVTSAHHKGRFTFEADRVESLQDFISRSDSRNYNNAVNLISNIGMQMRSYIEYHNCAIPYFSLEDIVVVNSDTFIFINNSKIIPINAHNGKLQLKTPIQYNESTAFLPIEVSTADIKKLPTTFFITSSYYSIATLAIFFIINYKFVNSKDDIEVIGRPFLHTSLYFFIKRCMRYEPTQRIMLYV